MECKVFLLERMEVLRKYPEILESMLVLPAFCNHKPQSRSTDRERSSEPHTHKGNHALEINVIIIGGTGNRNRNRSYVIEGQQPA